MLPKKWIVKAKNPRDILKTLIKNRGVKDVEEFLNPKNPLVFSSKEFGLLEKNLKKAAKRILLSKKRKEIVVVYGDYDVDGVCATSLLWEALHALGVEAYPYIPDRFTDGYGMAISGIEKICEKYPEVAIIISVDNGIVANDAIKAAQSKNIEVIVTDHHESNGKCPANILVHSTKICGTVVAWCLAKEFYPGGASKGMDLVGIATIADQMSLVNINRSLAFFGIKALRESTRIGIKALCEEAQIVQSKVGSYEIGYIIGPRMNAAGRLSQATEVVRLLCTNNLKRAQEISKLLSDLNKKRQEITTMVLDSARSQSNTYKKISMVVGNFHEGVIGLAAGKLTEETRRPAIVFSSETTVVKGSARSISGFHITEALRKFESMFINVGGHAMAAGFSIKKRNLSLFLKNFSEYIEKNLSEELFLKEMTVDCEVPLNLIDLKLYNEISKMEPFGNGNLKPLFLTPQLNVVSLKDLGKTGEHKKLVVSNGQDKIDALLFRANQWEDLPEVGTKLDLVYSIDENNWNGRKTVQLLIKDFNSNGNTR